MSSGKDYPRQAAHTQRQARRAQAEIALMHAQTALEQARCSVVEANNALQEQLAQRLGIESGQGPSSAHILQREAAFGDRQARATHRLRALLLKAQARETAMAVEYTTAQRLLADAHAAEQVLERDRERFGVEQRKHAAHAEQLEAEEQRPTLRSPRER